MKVVPTAGPIIQAPNTPTTAASSGREKAIAMLSGRAPEVNQTSLAPEEHKAAIPAKSIESGLEVSNGDSPAASEETQVASEESAPEAAKQLLSSQYAILARKEKALRARDLALRAKEEALKMQAAKPAESPQPYKPSIEERLKSDPISVLNEMGITYDQLTNSELNKPSPQEQTIAKLEAKIAALEEGNNKVNKRFEDQQTQSYQQALKSIENEVKQLVRTDASYETIRETGSVKDVVDLIEETFKKDGILLSVEDASREVEDYLVEEALKLTRIKKIQQRLTPATKPAASQQQPTSKQPALKTLTNAISAPRQLSARERAILAAEGKLNK